MSIPAAAIIPIIATVLELCLGLVALGFSVAPGWRRTRTIAVLALTCASFGAVNIATVMPGVSAETVASLARIGLPMGALNSACWLWYAFGGPAGEWSLMPRWARRLFLGTVIVGTAIPWLGLATVPGELIVVDAGFGLRYVSARLTAYGHFVLGMMFAVLVPTMVHFVRAARRREPGATLHVIGFAVFIVCGATEALGVSGWYRGPHLADVGFVALMVPVAVTAIRRVIDDASRLEAATVDLAGEVAVATEARDRAEHALVEAERQAAIGRLAAGVGHEINNPLTYLRLHLEQLQQWASASDLPPAVHEGIAAIDDGASRITRIVRDLRDTARSPVVVTGPVSVGQLIDSARRIAAHHLAGVDRLDVELDADRFVVGDEARLVQVLVNLLGNAAQAIAERHAPGPSHIRIVVDGAGARVRLRIIDSGVGIGAAQLRRVTEPFATTRATRGGTGLGLFLSRQIVEQHGGRLEITSTEGEGTTVSIALPGGTMGAPTIGAAVSPVNAATPTSERLQVWVIDDDTRVLDSLARALERVAEVETMTDGRAAIERLSGGALPDVLLCDLMMPGVDGIEVAEAVSAISPALRSRTVFLTGGATTSRAAEFVSRKDVRVLYKPVMGRELVEVVLSAHEVSAAA